MMSTLRIATLGPSSCFFFWWWSCCILISFSAAQEKERMIVFQTGVEGKIGSTFSGGMTYDYENHRIFLTGGTLCGCGHTPSTYCIYIYCMYSSHTSLSHLDVPQVLTQEDFSNRNFPGRTKDWPRMISERRTAFS